ncbi:RloB family protein [Nonomuraea sp. NEAU-A123]|uniref:RloB family protein n=1 Tax=Nonomuraea sp. NEAU-A123 TaxID=2839649 RepID=UPI001BE47FC9|nr:RloB domain-containing protein [Nonomuraea sp. NEAU-A123]
MRTDTDLEHKKKGTRQERASFLILCEGKTEKDYFVGMRSRQGPHIDVDAPKVDHLSIIRQAVARRSDEYDAVWCVLDTELDEALTSALISEAKRGSIDLCLSTPCFEVWLIMHHTDCTRPFLSANEAKRKLKFVAPGWSEGNTRFSDFLHGLDAACLRARQLDPTGEDFLRNPSTNAWQLVLALRPEA